MSEPTVGPWTSTTKTKLQVNAFEVEITKTQESSHVPPPCGQDEQEVSPSPALVEILQKGIMLVMQKLDEIRAAQRSSEPE